ncbi:hypothetical protein NQ317_005204 [Molorchus minor]|uniref:Multidrug resistance-associated protein lethal(2)03659 n=1 Tax=Molorchus minor TaxID=1323400 RepID=A0ABQ9JSN2_9CUCU|nr:hypothetical protein NQ317_005204 [Molorchus minor]
MRASDDDDDEFLPENPREKANCFSAVTFWYTLGIFYKGSRRELDESDLTKPLDEHKSQVLGDKLAKIWTKEHSSALKNDRDPSMAKVILKAFHKDILKFGVILMIVELGVRPGFPMYFNRVFYYFSAIPQSPVQKEEAYFFASGIMVCSLIVVMTVHPYMMAALHIGMKVRIACCSLIYRKALRIKLSALGGGTVGNAVNLMSNDVNRFDIAPMFVHYLWIAPVQAILCVVFLYLKVGYAAVIGIATMLVFLPIQVILGSRMSVLRRKAAVRTDERVRQMNEIVQAMQVIKMYAWENAFTQLIYQLRKKEMDILLRTSYIKGIIMSFIMFTARTCVFLTILAILMSGLDMTTENVYLAVSYYQILRETMTVYFPQGIGMVAEAFVSISRIQQFMLTEEAIVGDPTPLDPNLKFRLRILLGFEKPNQPLKSNETAIIKIVHGMAIYEDSICLEDINLEVQPGTIRQNILFGREFEIKRYREVVRVCALRARVNLARAVYKKGDIYLLDDPLSAVDINVGAQLFDNCIKEYLKDKVVILVTHQLQYLKKADQIVLLKDGLIKGKGTYNQLVKGASSFAHLLEEQQTPTEDESEDELERVIRVVSIGSAAFNSMIDIEGLKRKPDPGMYAEMRTSGTIDLKNYKEYFRAGANCCGVFVMVGFFILAQVFASLSDWFVSTWVNLEEHWKNFGTAASLGVYDKLTRKNCVTIFAIFISCTMIVAISRSLYFFTLCMRSSVRLHDRMFKSIICTSMQFFNTNTSGRILNRFSKDMGAVDELLPYAFIDTVQFMLNLLGAIILVSLLEVRLLIPTAIMLVLFYFLRLIYLKTSRNVKRLEGITRSPVFAHLNASLQGLPTIRSNGAEQTLVKEFDKLQDTHSSSWFMFLATHRAFGYWLDLICTFFIGVVTFSFILIGIDSDGSNVGLAITQCIGLSGLIQWGMRQSAELENQMTSVERVLEFARLEPETNLESVGIVGRTGAGKSSLISALFRLANFKGQILIDNLDISVIGIHDVRRKISIIPQEPVIFSGTLRYNLDPFNEHDDETIYDTLVDVEVKTALTYGRECLTHIMLEGGKNISVGERQMVCLVRAILRNNRILIMDEATANIDTVTDKFIQGIVRKKFAHCTVLTIAHRLHTIMDSDKVLVMDAGRALEFDHPHLLLQNKNSIFYDMVQHTGLGMSETLTRIAQESYAARQKSSNSL